MKQIGAMKLFAMSLVHCEDVFLSTEDLNLKQIKLYESIEKMHRNWVFLPFIIFYASLNYLIHHIWSTSCKATLSCD